MIHRSALKYAAFAAGEFRLLQSCEDQVDADSSVLTHLEWR